MSKKSALLEGESFYKRGNYSAALSYFLSIPEDKEIDPIDLSYYLGLCYAKLENYDDSILYLEQVITSASEKQQKSDERILQCRYLLAVIYCISGRKKMADFELNRLLETGYKAASVFSSMAYIAYEQNNVELSLEYYQKAMEYDNQNPTALNGMAYVLACEGEQLTKALTMCKKALEYSPRSSAYLDTMGWIYFRMGLYKEAKKSLEKALQISPDNLTIEEHLDQVRKAEV